MKVPLRCMPIEILSFIWMFTDYQKFQILSEERFVPLVFVKPGMHRPHLRTLSSATYAATRRVRTTHSCVRPTGAQSRTAYVLHTPVRVGHSYARTAAGRRPSRPARPQRRPLALAPLLAARTRARPARSSVLPPHSPRSPLAPARPLATPAPSAVLTASPSRQQCSCRV